MICNYFQKKFIGRGFLIQIHYWPLLDLGYPFLIVQRKIVHSMLILCGGINTPFPGWPWYFHFYVVGFQEAIFFPMASWILDCPSSKGKHAPTQKFERTYGKTQNPKFFWNRSSIGASRSLESSVKRILRRFESNHVPKFKNVFFFPFFFFWGGTSQFFILKQC